jgi:hypothetical protein
MNVRFWRKADISRATGLMAQFYFALERPSHWMPFPELRADFPKARAIAGETVSNRVRILKALPLSVATPGNFRIEKFVPPFPPVGRSVRRPEQKVVPICSKLLPVS